MFKRERRFTAVIPCNIGIIGYIIFVFFCKKSVAGGEVLSVSSVTILRPNRDETGAIYEITRPSRRVWCDGVTIVPW